MKSKTLIVVILLSLLITIPIFSQESKNYNQIVQTEFGIDSKKNYSGADLIEIIAICLEEKDIAIETAYNEGYKSGVLEYSPDVEYYKKQCELLELNNETLKQQVRSVEINNIKNDLICFSVGSLLGGITGCIITLKSVP
ncbi:MAG: hypothetical protein MJZ37_01125 [Bacilli bacterium]|nr:hypothetical protein [Bacilli bacterium]